MDAALLPHIRVYGVERNISNTGGIPGNDHVSALTLAAGTRGWRAEIQATDSNGSYPFQGTPADRHPVVVPCTFGTLAQIVATWRAALLRRATQPTTMDGGANVSMAAASAIHHPVMAAPHASCQQRAAAGAFGDLGGPHDSSTQAWPADASMSPSDASILPAFTARCPVCQGVTGTGTQGRRDASIRPLPHGGSESPAAPPVLWLLNAGGFFDGLMQWVAGAHRVHGTPPSPAAPEEDPGAPSAPLFCPGECGHVVGTLRAQPDAERLLDAIILATVVDDGFRQQGIPRGGGAGGGKTGVGSMDGGTRQRLAAGGRCGSPSLDTDNACSGPGSVNSGRSASDVPGTRETAHPGDVDMAGVEAAPGGGCPMACDDEQRERGGAATAALGQAKKREKKRRGEGVFDFSRFATRHIAMEVAYIGTRYHGFASQGSTHPTVEGCLFDALERTRLVEGRSALENYSRCGRTDRGVHAAGQVISLRVRSKRRARPLLQGRGGEGGQGGKVAAVTETSGADQGVRASCAGAGGDPDNHGSNNDIDSHAYNGNNNNGNSNRGNLSDSNNKHSMGRGNGGGINSVGEGTYHDGDGDDKGEGDGGDEIDYVTTMNRALPADIRVIGWCPVPDDFSARFSCRTRRYKYFFHADGLDVERMRDAACRLVGEHDFRNFCKMDAANVHSYGRTIHSFDIVPVDWFPRSLSGAGFFSMDVVGSAFLWHQVRCMAAVLFLVGARKEEPGVIDALLDIGRTPRKPQYELAPAAPLVLFSCTYDGIPLGGASQRGRDPGALQALRAMLVEQLIGCCVTGCTLHRLLPPNGYCEGELLGEVEEGCDAKGGDRLCIKPAASTHQAKGPKYVPLLRRHTEESYEERRQKLSSKTASCPSP